MYHLVCIPHLNYIDLQNPLILKIYVLPSYLPASEPTEHSICYSNIYPSSRITLLMHPSENGTMDSTKAY